MASGTGRLRRPARYAARAVELAGRAVQALGIVDLALEDDGGAVSAVRDRRPRGALLPPRRRRRPALVAACSPEAWPPG